LGVGWSCRLIGLSGGGGRRSELILWWDAKKLLDEGPCSTKICDSLSFKLIVTCGYKVLDIRFMGQNIRMNIRKI
jgi:hypothetical protein